MKRLPELKRELSEVRAQMQQIDQAANGGALEGEAETRWRELSTRADTLNGAIDRAERLTEMERRAPANQNTPDVRDAEQRFDLARGLRGQLRRMGADLAEEDDGLEREISAEHRRRSGLAEGWIIPLSALRRRPEQRALSYGAGSGSGAGLQAEEYRPDQFIPELQAVSLAGSLGVPFLTDLRGAPVTLPKITSGLALEFIAEGSPFTPADPDTDKVTLTPRIAGAVTSISPILLQQPQAQSIVSDHLLRVAAAGLDRVIFVGGGSNEPSGIWDTLTPTALGEPEWADILGLTEAIELDNVQARLGWAMNPSAKRKLRSTPKLQIGSPVQTTVGDFIMQNANTLADYPAVSSTTIPVTGSPPSAAGLIHGDFSEVVAGVWESASILLNPYSSGDFLRGQIGVRVLLLCDVAVKREEAFRAATIAI
jgi:HK97 family phage major capsid protein